MIQIPPGEEMHIMLVKTQKKNAIAITVAGHLL